MSEPKEKGKNTYKRRTLQTQTLKHEKTSPPKEPTKGKKKTCQPNAKRSAFVDSDSNKPNYN